VAGLEPLTKWTLPQSTVIAPAKSAPENYAEATVVWAAQLPDRVVALKATAAGITALSHDGSLASITPEGKLTAAKPLTGSEIEQTKKDLASPSDPAATEAVKSQARPDRMLKLTAASNGQVAVAYWGGGLRIVDAKGGIKTQQQLSQDITALTWLDGKVIAGLADGRVVALTV